jgi:hypothetical protein
MRLIRPFNGLEEFEAITQRFALRVAGRHLSDGESMRLDPGEYIRAQVFAELSTDADSWVSSLRRLDEAAAALDIRSDQLEIVATASTAFLHIVDVVWRCRVSDLDPENRTVLLSTSPRPRALQASHHGAAIDIYICVAESLTPRPLAPSRSGTWLARATFRLSTDLDAVGFRPRPLTEDDAKRLGLPSGTVRFVDVVGSPLEDLRADDAVELWIDEALMARMSMASRTPSSRALQMQLFVDAVAAVAERARRDLRDETIDELDETLLGRMLVALGGAGADRRARDRLLGLLRDQPARFLAHVEDRIGLRREFVRLLGDDT